MVYSLEAMRNIVVLRQRRSVEKAIVIVLPANREPVDNKIALGIKVQI